mmetsp:Transcript_17109/g.49576  ORF Transcript_17109/g.49576 Transcript_17109/m.49576 type:complete len:324 (-) Transcript_17109:21-992(-)
MLPSPVRSASCLEASAGRSCHKRRAARSQGGEKPRRALSQKLRAKSRSRRRWVRPRKCSPRSLLMTMSNGFRTLCCIVIALAAHKRMTRSRCATLTRKAKPLSKSTVDRGNASHPSAASASTTPRTSKVTLSSDPLSRRAASTLMANGRAHMIAASPLVSWMTLAATPTTSLAISGLPATYGAIFETNVTTPRKRPCLSSAASAVPSASSAWRSRVNASLLMAPSMSRSTEGWSLTATSTRRTPRFETPRRATTPSQEFKIARKPAAPTMRPDAIHLSVDRARSRKLLQRTPPTMPAQTPKSDSTLSLQPLRSSRQLAMRCSA